MYRFTITILADLDTVPSFHLVGPGCASLCGYWRVEVLLGIRGHLDTWLLEDFLVLRLALLGLG